MSPESALPERGTTAADGTHTVTARARDAAGNATVSPPQTMNVSNAAAPPAAADAYVSTTGSDSAACTQTAPCQTFNRVYHLLAVSGGTALVAAGTYPAQSVVAPYATKTVTIRAAAADSVYVASLTIAASHVHVSDVSGTGTGQARADLGVCNTACSPALTDVQVVNPHFRSAFIRSSNVTVRGGEVGGFDACQANAPEDAFRLWSGSTDVTPSNDVIDHVWIHDVTSGVGNTCQGTVHAGFHVDCMQNAGGANDLFTSIVFTGCPTSDVQMQPFAGAVIHDVTFDHVYFGKTACCNVIVLGDTVSNSLCSTLHITNSVLSGTPNKGACTSIDLQSNTTCVTVDQAGCAVPAVPFAAAAASVAVARKR
jgi:hypothetical protein